MLSPQDDARSTALHGSGKIVHKCVRPLLEHHQRLLARYESESAAAALGALSLSLGIEPEPAALSPRDQPHERGQAPKRQNGPHAEAYGPPSEVRLAPKRSQAQTS
ncbi:MAG: hypothetical protein ACI841_005384 [Planctomycetota bacterium]|jgi:hypothetical protein